MRNKNKSLFFDLHFIFSRKIPCSNVNLFLNGQIILALIIFLGQLWDTKDLFFHIIAYLSVCLKTGFPFPIIISSFSFLSSTSF